jgi:hypothetical protein
MADKPELPPSHLSLLEAVHELRLADRDLLNALCSRPAEPGSKQGFGPEAIKKAVRELLRGQHLLGSKWFPKRRKIDGYGGRNKQVLMLGKRGYEALGLKHTVSVARRALKVAETPEKFRHEMMISWWKTLILKAQQRGMFRLVEWHQGGRDEEGGIYEEYEDDSGTPRRMRLNPDARFCLQTERGRVWFFLEAETGEKDAEHVVNHLVKYSRAWEYRLFERVNPEITDFVVVVLLKTTAKIPARLAAAQHIYRLKKRVIFTSEQSLDLENPDRLGDLFFNRLDGKAVPLVPGLSTTNGRGASVQVPGAGASTSPLPPHSP